MDLDKKIIWKHSVLWSRMRVVWNFLEVKFRENLKKDKNNEFTHRTIRGCTICWLSQNSIPKRSVFWLQYEGSWNFPKVNFREEICKKNRFNEKEKNNKIAATNAKRVNLMRCYFGYFQDPYFVTRRPKKMLSIETTYLKTLSLIHT